jgi:hypothetical protein
MEEQATRIFCALLLTPALGYFAPVPIQLIVASVGSVLVGSLKSIKVR